MIVCCDTSPLTSLAAIGRFDLLLEIYGELHIPGAVWDELNQGGVGWPGRDEVDGARWIHRHQVANTALVVTLTRDLDRGEAETIALALELGAELVLLDEREGRRAAQRLALHVSGVLGTLLAAKSKGLLLEMRPCLDDLRRIGFYLTDGLYSAVLETAGEPA